MGDSSSVIESLALLRALSFTASLNRLKVAENALAFLMPIKLLKDYLQVAFDTGHSVRVGRVPLWKSSRDRFETWLDLTRSGRWVRF